MNKTPFIFIIAIVSLLSVAPGHTEIYKWTDSNGVVHFGGQPPDSEKSEIVNVTVTRPSISDSSSESAKVDSGSERRGQNKKVIMYSTAWCPYCRKAREYFKKKGIRFVEYDVEKLPRRMREFKKLGGTGYPLILIGKNQQMQGFSVSGFDRRYSR